MMLAIEVNLETLCHMSVTRACGGSSPSGALAQQLLGQHYTCSALIRRSGIISWVYANCAQGTSSQKAAVLQCLLW